MASCRNCFKLLKLMSFFYLKEKKAIATTTIKFKLFKKTTNTKHVRLWSIWDLLLVGM